MSSIIRIFENLPGTWQLHRSIIGQTNVQNMEGTAYFWKKDANQETLHYKEERTLTLKSGKKFNAYREYIYQYQDGKISIFFVENGQSDRLFQTLNFSAANDNAPLKATAAHLCGEDVYNAAYVFYNNSSFNITYTVKGPNKNYISQTFFTKKLADAGCI